MVEDKRDTLDKLLLETIISNKDKVKQFNEKSSRNRLEKRIRNTIIDALELANIHANKSEIRHWLKIKISKFPFTSISQSLHSLKLLSISTFQNKS